MGKVPDKETINNRTDDVPIKIIKVCGGALIKFVLANINHNGGDLKFYRRFRILLGRRIDKGKGFPCFV